MLGWVGAVNAQTLRAFKKAGAKAMVEKDFYSAMEYYRQASEKAPKSIELQFLTAEAARNFQAYDIAKGLYAKVVESGEAFPEARFYLATIKKGAGDYEAAKIDFQTFLAANTSNENLKTAAKKEIENCDWAIRELSNAKDFKVRHLKRSINTPYSEFAPMMRGDTLYYSSLRFVNKEDKQSPKRKISKVLYSVKASRGRPLPRKFNEAEKSTAYAAMSPGGDRIYYTICEYIPKRLDLRCSIYFRKKDKRKRWGKPKPLSEEINLAAYTATQPQVVYDSLLASEVLYFVSDRPEGKGGLDIWYTVLKKNGKNGAIENLERINTAGDEVSPFFYSRDQTLFFSSNAYPGFGGYDVFKSSKKSDNTWDEISNLGAPINSSYNDLYYSLNTDATVAHLASNREGALYLDRSLKSCCNDIFRIDFPEEPKEVTPTDSVPVVLIPPQKDTLLIVDVPKIITPEPKEPTKPFEPTKLEDFLPLALYFDNDEPDKRTRRSTTRKTYQETFQRYYDQKQTYLREYTDGLSEEKRWEAEDLMESFFESEVRRDAELLDRFSEILLRRLEGGETIEIFLKGFTSPRANSDYNLTLGQRRISSVRNHFFQYRNNIFVNYLNSGKLKLTERSFGETSAKQNVIADLADRRNSIYSIDAARERRVEIMEIQASK